MHIIKCDAAQQLIYLADGVLRRPSMYEQPVAAGASLVPKQHDVNECKLGINKVCWLTVMQILYPLCL